LSSGNNRVGRQWKNQALLSDGLCFFIFHRSDGMQGKGFLPAKMSREIY